MNLDVLTGLDLAAMTRFPARHRPLATLAVSDRTTSRYFLFNMDGLLRGWENTKTGECRPALTTGERAALQRKAFSGIHVINPRLLSLVTRRGKFSMVDVYLDL